MTAKEYLLQYEYAVRRIHRIEQELEEETILIDSIRSVTDYDGMPHGTNTGDPTADKAMRLADAKIRLVNAKLNAIQIRQTVFDFILSIPDVEGDVLYLRYIMLEKWNQIADKLVYTLPGIYNVHSRALKIVEARLQDIEDNEE